MRLKPGDAHVARLYKNNKFINRIKPGDAHIGQKHLKPGDAHIGRLYN